MFGDQGHAQGRARSRPLTPFGSRPCSVREPVDGVRTYSRKETDSMTSAGHAIVRSLENHGIDRIYTVPGESFLDVLDGLHDSSIDTVVCRHEGGAAYMAEAEGKLTDLPGVAMVTRGPGAANAHVGLHTAWQDSTAMVLFVGLIPFEHREKEAFQEFDPKAWFDTGAKRVMVLDHPERANELVAEAIFAARSGRPGPVVVGLPEDIIQQQINPVPHPEIPIAMGGMTVSDWKELHNALLDSEKPLFVFGGNDWTQKAAADFTAWLEAHDLPAGAEWRCEGTVPFTSPSYIGPLGYGRPAHSQRVLDEADLIVFVGTVPGDVITGGFTSRQDWNKRNFLVTIDPGLRGRSGPVTHQIVAKPDVFVRDLLRMDLPVNDSWKSWRDKLRGLQVEFSTLPERKTSGQVTMDSLMSHLVPRLPEDCMVTFGAGEHTNWAHRYFPTHGYARMISARNGSMGYSVPSAVAASLRHPERLVVSIAGDGEFLMNGQELATAAQYGAKPLVIVADNGEYGTIRTHQERQYPERISGTQLQNPDFALLAQAYGGFGIRVEDNESLPQALDDALHAVDDGRFAVIHLVVPQRDKAD